MEPTQSNRLKYFPITLFASVMGLAGLSIVLLKMAHVLHFSVNWGVTLLYVVCAWFVVLNIIYAVKWIKYPEEVKVEFNHPVRMHFFPAYSICFLLFAIAFLNLNPAISKATWWIGAVIHLLLLLRTLYSWFHKNYKLQSFNPAWFIPVVGPILVPVAGVQAANPEISWFFFSVGIIYWIGLLSILLYRVIFHDPLPTKLVPTLFILIAPAAVGFIAYIKLTHSLDPFSRILFYFGVFTVLMLFTMVDKFTKVPFFISWWAYTFPLDAVTLATVLMYELTHFVFFKVLAGIFMAFTILIIGFVLIKTIQAVGQKRLCVPEG
ncbi:MAG: SLAC1 anion channel family protein [Deltaproteobacteria bacterium]|nr:SLAC1 anion channel family protein [Deltaproteobacteria bacterium]